MNIVLLKNEIEDNFNNLKSCNFYKNELDQDFTSIIKRINKYNNKKACSLGYSERDETLEINAINFNIILKTYYNAQVLPRRINLYSESLDPTNMLSFSKRFY